MKLKLNFKIGFEVSMRTMKKVIASCIVFVLLLCGMAAAGEYPSVVCTSFPCYDFARAVMGDKAVFLNLLIKPGVEVHSYEPTPADIMAIAGCDLFIYIGGESDAWVEDILASFGSDVPKTLRLFDCVEAVEAEHGHEDDHDHAEEYDEHIWTSPVNAVRMVQAVADALIESHAWYADSWRSNADAYIAEIEILDGQFRAVVEGAARREMIFADRFPFLYFAQEYGIDYVSAFPSCAAESEPSAKTMMGLIDRVITDQIPAIYTIELSSGKTAQTISEETGAKVLTFHSVQNVSEADFSAGESYVSLMQRNLEALKEGLN